MVSEVFPKLQFLGKPHQIPNFATVKLKLFRNDKFRNSFFCAVPTPINHLNESLSVIYVTSMDFI